MENFKELKTSLTLGYLTEEQKYNQVLKPKDISRQQESIQMIKKMAESQSALPLIEHLIKHLVYEVILNPMT